jgi:uncharacterized repeat protein (TIGR03987 family)
MDSALIKAVTLMMLALICYTYAVFSGRRKGLGARQLVVFGLGLLIDAAGTCQMSLYAAIHGKAPELHNLTGILSLGGMAFHFLLALVATATRKAEAVNRTFHRVSLTIYSLWLMAFLTGAFFGMRNLAR